MSDASVLILGICACAVVCASQREGVAVAALLLGAFIVWLGSRDET